MKLVLEIEGKNVAKVRNLQMLVIDEFSPISANTLDVANCIFKHGHRNEKHLLELK